MKKIILSCVLIMGILLTACGKEVASSKLPTNLDNVNINDVEWVLPYELDMHYYTELESLEDNSEIIVQAKVVKKLGQKITNTYYNTELKADFPMSGNTKYQMQAVNVLKGDMKDGDSFNYSQAIFIFNDVDNVIKAKFFTNQLPLENGDEVLMFLNKNNDDSYYAVGDINGIYHKHKPGSYLNEKTFHSTKLESYSYAMQCKIYLDVTEKYYKYIFVE